MGNGYDPQKYLQNEELRAAVDWLGSNYFTPDEPPGVLHTLRDSLYHSDPFLCLADFNSYSECQKRVDAAFQEKSCWARKATLTPLEWENSRVIAPSQNTRGISGESSPSALTCFTRG